MKQRIAAHTFTHALSQQLPAAACRSQVWLAALLLWTLISATRSFGTPWAQAAGTEALRWAAGIGLAFSVSWLLGRAERAAPFFVLLTLGLTLFGVLGGSDAAGSGLTGPFHDHQLYGSLLLLLLPFSALLALSARTVAWRSGALAVFALGTLCLVLSQTRGAWISLAVSALVFGGLWLSRPAARPQRWRVALVPLALLLAGIAGLWALNGPPEQQVLLSARAATLGDLSADQSWQSRLRTWHDTTCMVAARPLLGIGLGRYPGQIGQLMPTARPSLSEQAHSFYGQTAAEIGLPGLGLYLLALGTFAAASIRRLRRSRHGSSEQNSLLLAVLSALAGQSVDALASPSWQFPEVSFFFWAVLGVGLASLRRPAPQSVSTRQALPVQRLGRFALSGGLVVVLAAHILPIGLLTPVEAYAAPATWTLDSATVSLVSPAAPVAGGTALQFNVTANYKDDSGNARSVNVTADNATGTGSVSYGGTVNTPSKSYFNTSFVNGMMTLAKTTYGNGAKLTVTVFYKDTKSNKGLYSNTLVVPIQPGS